MNFYIFTPSTEVTFEYSYLFHSCNNYLLGTYPVSFRAPEGGEGVGRAQRTAACERAARSPVWLGRDQWAGQE